MLVRSNQSHNDPRLSISLLRPYDPREAVMVTQLDHVLAEEKLANIMAENSWWKKVTLIWERNGR
jgi:hypothetical protein